MIKKIKDKERLDILTIANRTLQLHLLRLGLFAFFDAEDRTACPSLPPA